MLRRLAGDAADDLAQETFLSAWRSAAAFRGDGSYFAWLARIAWRQFLSRQRRERPTEPLDEAGEMAVDADAPRRSAIDQAMSRLGHRERMAALLCFAQGCPHGEAAAIMDIPLGTLKSLVARARGKLIHCLEDEQ
jgi:RNA polymerase sigma-70 factor (ECF subfamily)